MSRKGKFELFGKDKDGMKIYLERGSYDCNWYYGFGYLAGFEKHHKKQSTHRHWDSYFTGSKHVEPEDIKAKLHDITVDNLWLLCDLMKSFYSLRETSGIYERGNSHLASDNHGMLSDESIKEKIDRDTERVIRKVQNLIGMEEPDYIRNSKFGKDQFYDEGIAQ